MLLKVEGWRNKNVHFIFCNTIKTMSEPSRKLSSEK